MFTQPLNKEYLEALGLTAVLLLEEALEKQKGVLGEYFVENYIKSLKGSVVGNHQFFA